MFSGIIKDIGTVSAINKAGGALQLELESTLDLGEAGASVAVNGACLTVTDSKSPRYAFDVSAVTLRCTNLGLLELGQRVNLEPALSLNAALDGHLVSGHVDAQVAVLAINSRPGMQEFVFALPASLAKYVCVKGSVAVDGVSLTVNQCDEQEFTVNIVPHTMTNTIFNDYSVGRQVNLEIDLIARYLEKLKRSD